MAAWQGLCGVDESGEAGFNRHMVVPPLPDLSTLSHSQKDALIVALWEQVVLLITPTARAAETVLAGFVAA